MSGAQAARNCIGHDRVKETLCDDCYDPRTGCVFLSCGTFHGIDAGSIYRALHEAAHAQQEDQMPLRFSLSWLWPVRLWLEHNAWNRAPVMMRRLTDADPVTLEGIRSKCIGTYKFRARC